MSSRIRGRSGSNPPTWSQTSRRISMPAELTASTGRLPSCWPWSISPGSIPGIRRPARSTVTPASRSPRRSFRSISLGPSTAVERLRLAALSICSSASGTGSQSSCSSQTHSVAGSPDAGTGVRAAGCCSARATAAPYPVSASMPKTASGPRSSVRMAPDRSWLPVSTPIPRWTGCVCSRTPLTSPGSSRAPSCTTITRVTTWRTCKAFSDKGPVWWLRRHSVRLPARQERADYVNDKPPTIHDRTNHTQGLIQKFGDSRPPDRLPDLALEAAALALRHAAPDTEPLVVLERVLQALGPDLAAAAHSLGLPGRSSLLREERLRICLRAQCPVLPAQLFNLFRADEDLR